jgi:CheY-like chemotaxis protein
LNLDRFLRLYSADPEVFPMSCKTQRLCRVDLDGHDRSAALISQDSAAREVLVVDDDLGTRDALADLLEDCGYSVIAAADGREALDYLRHSSAPGIIILDLMMPVMDGWQFLQQQSLDPALLAIPVIVVTATPPLVSLRAKAVLQKPIQFKSLLEMLERFLPARM